VRIVSLIADTRQKFRKARNLKGRPPCPGETAPYGRASETHPQRDERRVQRLYVVSTVLIDVSGSLVYNIPIPYFRSARLNLRSTSVLTATVLVFELFVAYMHFGRSAQRGAAETYSSFTAVSQIFTISVYLVREHTLRIKTLSLFVTLYL
jgi:hypothetical protein